MAIKTLTVSKGTVAPLVKVLEEYRRIRKEQDEECALSLQADQLKVSDILCGPW